MFDIIVDCKCMLVLVSTAATGFKQVGTKATKGGESSGMLRLALVTEQHVNIDGVLPE